MTMQTEIFNYHKSIGAVRKAGRASFCDGQKHLYRTLWIDDTDAKLYVSLNGEFLEFKPYSHRSNEEGIIIGYI